MDLLSDEMGESSRELRKAAARRIAAVGAKIGPDAVRDEMIPFLAARIDDDDEILLIVSEQLGECATQVSGSTPLNLDLLIFSHTTFAFCPDFLIIGVSLPSDSFNISISPGIKYLSV